MTHPLFTIGHSTRTLPEFIALLQAAGVDRLIDIRTVPRSRTNPQFNRDTLPAALAAANIDYQYMKDLGGLRGRSKTVAPEVNGFWENASFHHYADYALTDAFHTAFEALLAQAGERRSAVMCAEAVWWRCHRRIVADYALARGLQVMHIMGAGRLEPAHLTPGAHVRADGCVVYPPAQGTLFGAAPAKGQADTATHAKKRTAKRTKPTADQPPAPTEQTPQPH